ncbi:hypothetical protein SAY87_002026 [Trapa incisa]|uniref:Uncharacterized protein n=1 Tax=Trapa incisa TaxID=236973 RepID=A0AAN7JV51_9MYRT|nr:hypothetical protein SAY87_002026 [Trapa incisa]
METPRRKRTCTVGRWWCLTTAADSIRWASPEILIPTLSSPTASSGLSPPRSLLPQSLFPPQRHPLWLHLPLTSHLQPSDSDDAQSTAVTSSTRISSGKYGRTSSPLTSATEPCILLPPPNLPATHAPLHQTRYPLPSLRGLQLQVSLHLRLPVPCPPLQANVPPSGLASKTHPVQPRSRLRKPHRLNSCFRYVAATCLSGCHCLAKGNCDLCPSFENWR